MKAKYIFIAAAALTCVCANSALGGEMQVFNLKNDIKVLFNKTSGVKVAAVKIFTPVSVICENPENAGISYLTAKLMAKSTKNRNNETLAKDIDDIGADLSADADYDYAVLGISCLSEYFEKASEILSDVLANPAFDEKETAFEKQNINAALDSRRDSIGVTASDTFIKLFYGDLPYGLPVLGRKESVNAVTEKDLKEWHKNSYNASNIIISVSGNADSSVVKKALEKYFGNIETGKKFEKPVFNRHDVKIDKKEIKGKFNQAYILKGFSAPPLSDKDFVTLKVINAILGGRMTSRLFVELREKMGLAYEVSAVYPTRIKESYFAVYIGLDKKNINLTLKRIDEILNDFRSGKVDEQELKDTKNYIKGIYVMDRQTVGKQSYYFGWREVIGQGWEYDKKYLEDIENVTPKDIYETANRIFSQKPLAVIINPGTAGNK